MIKIIVDKKVVQFLYHNGCVLELESGLRKYALPVLIESQAEHNDRDGVIMEYEAFSPEEFQVKNAQEYINMTVHSDMKGQLSDGYHTFNELYDHRIINFILVCKSLATDEYAPVWKSKAHSDGSVWEGWFIMGIYSEPGEQITYHLPMSYWEMTNFAKNYETAPPFDGHTPADVLERLKKLIAELE